MNLVDSHCHVHFNAYHQDRDAVIRRALDSGVTMITVGTQRDTSRVAAEVAEKFDGLYASVGLHPNHLMAMQFDEDELEVKTRNERFDPRYYAELANYPKVVAIGECGLDYYRLPEEVDVDEVKQLQEDTFRAHIELAIKKNLPLIIHCRDAHDELADILDDYLGRIRGVIHSFTGTRSAAERHLAQGFFIGINGIVTFPPRKNQTESLADMVKDMPLDRLLLETDAPYLTPVPRRGERNEPLYVSYVAAYIATLRGVSVEQLAQATTSNAKALFGLN